jgi:hypothetical protein
MGSKEAARNRGETAARNQDIEPLGAKAARNRDEPPGEEDGARYGRRLDNSINYGYYYIIQH